jgi:hypothetical protein
MLRGVVFAVAAALGSFSLAIAADTTVIRVGVVSEAIGEWRVEDGTLAEAIAALGPVSSCATVRRFPGFATVEWRRLGLRMVFGTYGPGGARPCRARRAVRLDRVRAYGKQWRTGRGLRIGDTVTRLRRLYPHTTLRAYRPGLAPVRGWWLVVRTSRVPDFHRVPALLATARDGRVTELVLNVEAEGD